MPDIFNTQKEEKSDDKGYISNNRNYVHNIPNAQGKPQK